MKASEVDEALARAYAAEWARLVASLARRYGDLDIAEDAAAEAFAVAVERWARDGVPPQPGGWLATTAARKALDRLRREAKRPAKHQAAHALSGRTPPAPTGPVADDRLRLFFVCCHPALGEQARVALTLRLLGGLSVEEIARAFFVAEATLGRRITRAKAKIRAAHIPFRVPSDADVRERLDGVLTVVYLIFNEGYLASGGEEALRPDLTGEAIRLGRLLRELVPDGTEVAGLLALMLLTDARRAARVTPAGELVTLEHQDRSVWDRSLIEEGHGLVRALVDAHAAGGPAPGRYQLMAAVNAVHAAAPTYAETAWADVLALYDQLVAVDPSPVVRLNRAVALAEVAGPARALAEVVRWGGVLDGYHAYHATRADLLRRLGRLGEARVAYDRAIALTGNRAEQAFLTRRRDTLA